jgi:hypothetical protein
MYNKHQNSTKKINLSLTMAFVLVIVILSAGALVLLSKRENTNSTEAPNGEIQFRPPTEEELQAAEDNKKRLSEEIDKQAQNPTQPSDGNKASVKPVIGYVEVSGDQVNANGFISTMIEEGGTCTLTLTKGSETAQTTNTALADAQSTVCGLMQISTSQLSSGEWTATISYSSDNYEGSSDPQTIGL